MLCCLAGALKLKMKKEKEQEMNEEKVGKAYKKVRLKIKQQKKLLKR